MIKRKILVFYTVIAVCVLFGNATSGELKPQNILFRENFDDANLKNRQWYDMTQIRIVGDAVAGKGCIEYEWIDKKSKVQGSSGMRRLFKPTDEIYIRFYLRLSGDCAIRVKY